MALAVILECWVVEYTLQGRPGRCGFLVQPHPFSVLLRLYALFPLLPSLSSKFSTSGRRGTRLMLVNEVALGECKVLLQKQSVSLLPIHHLSQDYWNEAKTLDKPPEGYNSVVGVKCTDEQPTSFKVLYNDVLRYLG